MFVGRPYASAAAAQCFFSICLAADRAAVEENYKQTISSKWIKEKNMVDGRAGDSMGVGNANAACLRPHVENGLRLADSTATEHEQ